VTAEEIQRGLREALRAAMKARDTVAVSALRSVLAAIANAEAVTAPGAGTGAGPASGAARGGSQHVAGSAAGLGAAEAPRRELSGADIAAIIAAEVTERRAAAGQFDSTGNAGRAARLRREAEVIEGCARR
jgi:uncharacterized protein